MRLVCLFFLATALVLPAAAQRNPFVRVTGEGVVSFKPDQMKLTVSVITLGDTAQQAADDNATRSTSVINALQKVLGGGGDLQTLGYSVNPNYKYPHPTAASPPSPATPPRIPSRSPPVTWPFPAA